ncbi:hypothetical protein Hanom_Chr00s006787g01735551 [Helianthus anomalus]
MELTNRMKMSKISNLLAPDAKKQTFERKSQNWPNLRDLMAFYSIKSLAHYQ